VLPSSFVLSRACPRRPARLIGVKARRVSNTIALILEDDCIGIQVRGHRPVLQCSRAACTKWEPRPSLLLMLQPVRPPTRTIASWIRANGFPAALRPLLQPRSRTVSSRTCGINHRITLHTNPRHALPNSTSPSSPNGSPPPKPRHGPIIRPRRSPSLHPPPSINSRTILHADTLSHLTTTTPTKPRPLLACSTLHRSLLPPRRQLSSDRRSLPRRR
jgi:hypothetical protein